MFESLFGQTVIVVHKSDEENAVMGTEIANTTSATTPPANETAVTSPDNVAGGTAVVQTPGESEVAKPASTPGAESSPDTTTSDATTEPKRTTSEPLGLPPTDQEEQDEIAEDTVLLAYQLELRGGRQEVVRVKSQLVLPLALDMDNLAQTDVSFSELVDKVIVRPLVTKFRSFLQRRFDDASKAQKEAQAKAKTSTQPKQSPAHAELARLLTRPIIHTPSNEVEEEGKPPYPQPPGYRSWPASK